MQFIRTIYFLIIFLIFLLIISACNWYGISVVPATTMIEQYKTLYIEIDLNQSFNNPYNPAEIKVDAIINAPTGQVITLPCFYIDDPSGKSSWQARFTPVEIGPLVNPGHLNLIYLY